MTDERNPLKSELSVQAFEQNYETFRSFNHQMWCTLATVLYRSTSPRAEVVF